MGRGLRSSISRARPASSCRGNIYLAKVTRVEPSLQAAFVEYGGNRHGFLAFNEIHPDYYQIPHADREALMREAAEEGDEENGHAAAPANGDEEGEAVGGLEDEVDADEEVERRRRRILKRYKIQDVIRRRQIMLVQVVKEERGNKGAALTTYLSLAGRYCVLMPNTDRGGGISRKITSATDRKRLRTIVQGLAVPTGMGLIVRTAGAKRTKAEIKPRLRLPGAHLGEHPRHHAALGGAGADLRGRGPGEAGDPRPLRQGHRRHLGRGRGRLQGGARLHARADAGAGQEGAGLSRGDAAVRAAPHRGAPGADLFAGRAAEVAAATW